jgi:membrane-associated protease RseP (regulator of RpoE activity)
MLAVYWLLTTNLIGLILGTPEAGPVGPLLPGITIRLTTLPYMLIAFVVVIVSHEASHGIAAAAERLHVRSSGLILFVILPGAFVELDDREVSKASVRARLRIFSAGSYSNFVVAVLAIGILSAGVIMTPVFYGQANGLLVTDVIEGTPAYGSIPLYTVIRDINNTAIFDHESLRAFLGNIDPGALLEINTDSGLVYLITGAHPNNASIAYIGIVTTPSLEPTPLVSWLGPVAPFMVYYSIYWVFFLAFNIAIFNMLPVPGFDGDRTVNDLIELANSGKKRSKLQKQIIWGLRIFALVLILGNIGVTLLRYGTLPII